MSTIIFIVIKLIICLLSRIDKFLEGYTSDGAEIPEQINQKNIKLHVHALTDDQFNKPPQNNTSILVSINYIPK